MPNSRHVCWLSGKAVSQNESIVTRSDISIFDQIFLFPQRKGNKGSCQLLAELLSQQKIMIFWRNSGGRGSKANGMGIGHQSNFKSWFL